jgi:rfaE bifunctional protein kinase chain/domain
VVKIERSDERPGGAANVARNIAALGAKVMLLSVVGADETAQRLRRVLDSDRIEHVLQEDAGIRTTLKLRVIGHQQQMLRIDFENVPSDHSLAAKKSEFLNCLDGHDIVVFSDYRKGALDRVSEMLALARDRGKLAIVDPKGCSFSRYAGASVITPNRAELSEVTGGWDDETEMDHKAQRLREELKLDALLLTMSEQGMKLYRDEGSLHRRARAREVYDVSGAGDTVVAALAVARGIGKSWEEAIDFANAAAGIVVSRLGTAAATLAEVVSALQAEEAAQ